jgi:hypothetical protein
MDLIWIGEIVTVSAWTIRELRGRDERPGGELGGQCGLTTLRRSLRERPAQTQAVATIATTPNVRATRYRVSDVRSEPRRCPVCTWLILSQRRRGRESTAQTIVITKHRDHPEH